MQAPTKLKHINANKEIILFRKQKEPFRKLSTSLKSFQFSFVFEMKVQQTKKEIWLENYSSELSWQ